MYTVKLRCPVGIIVIIIWLVKNETFNFHLFFRPTKTGTEGPHDCRSVPFNPNNIKVGDKYSNVQLISFLFQVWFNLVSFLLSRVMSL